MVGVRLWLSKASPLAHPPLLRDAGSFQFHSPATQAVGSVQLVVNCGCILAGSLLMVPIGGRVWAFCEDNKALFIPAVIPYVFLLVLDQVNAGSTVRAVDMLQVDVAVCVHDGTAHPTPCLGDMCVQSWRLPLARSWTLRLAPHTFLDLRPELMSPASPWRCCKAFCLGGGG
jgi:hypothetical protein